MSVDLSALAGKLYIPDGSSPEEAARRVTHMAIGAHQDDLEIFAYHGIETCYDEDSLWFAGVTVTDGGGSARTGNFAQYRDDEMKALRREEQNEAARLGRYALQAQLGYPSSVAKDVGSATRLRQDLVALLMACRPQTLYLHNPADKHDTHIAVLQRCIDALRQMPPADRPSRVFGCEVWRDLDWLADDGKIALPVGRLPELEANLIRVFRSQVEGGKDYVSATIGRRRANATFFQPRSADASRGFTFAIDLQRLLEDESMTLASFVKPHLDAFQSDVLERLDKYLS